MSEKMNPILYKYYSRMTGDVLFETEEEAQRILDKKYPRHTIVLKDNGDADIFKDGERVCKIRGF